MRATHLPLLLGGLGLALGVAAVIAARRQPTRLLVGVWRVEDGWLVIPGLQLAHTPTTRWGSGKEEAARESERPIDYACLADTVRDHLNSVLHSAGTRGGIGES